METSKDLLLLVSDLIQITHSLACALEKVVTSFEQVSGRIPEERELAVVASQFAGLYQRAEKLLHPNVVEGSSTRWSSKESKDAAL